MKKVLGLLLLSSSLFGMELALVQQAALTKAVSKNTYARSEISSKKTLISPESIFAPHRLGDVELVHGKNGFSVYKDNKKHDIQKCFTDKEIRNVTKEELQSFLAFGYVCLNQMEDGEYSLRAKARINGGGPILGTIAYWTTKVICYAVPIAATATVVVATGGAAGAAVGAGAAGASTAIAGAAAASTTGAAIATTTGLVTGTAATAAAVGTGAGVVGGAIAGAGLAGEAALITAAGVTAVGATGGAAAVGTAAATVMAIESVSVAVGTFFGMLPTP